MLTFLILRPIMLDIMTFDLEEFYEFDTRGTSFLSASTTKLDCESPYFSLSQHINSTKCALDIIFTQDYLTCSLLDPPSYGSDYTSTTG